jgi:hypothetical protein
MREFPVRGAAIARWCTELSTKCVDKEISSTPISLCLTLLRHSSEGARK